MKNPCAFRLLVWLSALFTVAACEQEVVEEPGPEVLLKTFTPAYLALSPERLFVATVDLGTTNTVVSIPRSGGQPHFIANCDCSGLALSSQYLFWTTFAGPLKRANLDGSQIVTLADMYDSASPVADDQWVYAAVQSDSGKIFRVATAGGAVQVLAENQHQAGSLALDATHVYWTTFGSSGAVRRMKRDGGPIEDLASNVSSPGDLKLDSSHAYWVDRPGDSGRVMRVSLAGGTPQVLASVDAPLGLAIDDQYVYWGNSRPITGMVRRVPLEGGKTIVVASNQDWPAAVVVDSEYVYWANSRGGTVMRKATSQIH